jgi:hypothetical protein
LAAARRSGIDLRLRPLSLHFRKSGPGLEKKWWRRRELNPRPKLSLAESLHTYSCSCFPLKGNVRRPRSEHDKKREPLALVLAATLRRHVEASLLCDALSRPVGEAAEDGYLTN